MLPGLREKCSLPVIFVVWGFLSWKRKRFLWLWNPPFFRNESTGGLVLRALTRRLGVGSPATFEFLLCCSERHSSACTLQA